MFASSSLETSLLILPTGTDIILQLHSSWGAEQLSTEPTKQGSKRRQRMGEIYMQMLPSSTTKSIMQAFVSPLPQMLDRGLLLVGKLTRSNCPGQR